MHYDKLMNLIIVKKVRTYCVLLTVHSKRQKKDIKSAASSGPFHQGGKAGARRSVRGASNIRPFRFLNIRLLFSLHCQY